MSVASDNPLFGSDGRVETALFRLTERNEVAEGIIANYCAKNAAIDGLSGFVGGLVPVPGTSIAVFAGQMTYQFRSTYPAMLQELGDVYDAQPDAVAKRIFTRSLVVQGILEGLVQELLWEIATEGGGGVLVGAVPYWGAPIGAAADVYLAVAMTWRVGVLISAYFQNQGFIDGDRKRTLELLKPITPGSKFSLSEARPVGRALVDIAKRPRQDWGTAVSEMRPELERFARVSRPGTLENVRTAVRPVNERLVTATILLIDSMKLLTPERSKLREVLTRTSGTGALGIPPDIVDAALARVAGLT